MRYEKFYNNERKEYIAPLKTLIGHFHLDDWLKNSFMKAEDLEKKYSEKNKIKLFLLHIDSWYSSFPDGTIIKDPTMYYYFDFKDKKFRYIYRDDFEKAKKEILS